MVYDEVRSKYLLLMFLWRVKVIYQVPVSLEVIERL